MSQKGFFFDQSRCTGCRTCSVACADLHSSPVGEVLRRVIEFEGGKWTRNADGTWRQNVFAYYTSIGCNQCADPACVKVCPTKAHFKRKEDGLVVIDTAKCIGCGMCAKKCPAGAIRIEDNCAHIDGVDCLSCGMCAVVCPHGAIHDRTGIAAGV